MVASRELLEREHAAYVCSYVRCLWLVNPDVREFFFGLAAACGRRWQYVADPLAFTRHAALHAWVTVEVCEGGGVELRWQPGRMSGRVVCSGVRT